jgi:1,4-dihydroxy-2-naphthoate octaprenyltransferase
MSSSETASVAIESRSVRFHLRTWLCALRPESFPVSVVPALLGVAIAWERGYRIDPLLAVLTLVGAVSIHAATNLLQDYFDFRGGLDREGTQGGSGVLVRGLATPCAILVASVIFYAVSAAIAGYLVYVCGLTLAWIVAASFVVGSIYAVPRYGLKYNLLGDVGVFAAFGIGITVGSCFVQTGVLDTYPLYYAVPFGLLVVALLHSNNMRDAGDDFEAGFKNTAYRMGAGLSRASYAALVFGAYVVLAASVLCGVIPRGAMAVLITFPLALKLVRNVVGADFEDKSGLGPQVGLTALLALAFGAMLIIGIVVYGLARG